MTTRRTAAELVEELAEEATGCNFAAIVVTFEATTQFVFSTDDDALERLAALLARGGEPIGLIAVRAEADPGLVSHRVFREFSDQEWAKDYLSNLVDTFQQRAVAAGLLKAGAQVTARPWVN